MSTFNGQIREISSSISVDHFENIEQKCYFLSHCHTDHMKGLSLLKTNAPLYTTAISSLIIQSICPQLTKNIRVLELGITTPIELQKDEENEAIHFNVVALSAGHCVGSCMLLFQIEGHNILYTGDFRMSLKNAKNIKLLEEIKNQEKITIYIDSTFMKTSFPQFPTQTESVMKIKEITKHFLDKSENHKVFLHVPARYGYEYLLMDLSSTLNEKIFIHEQNIYEQYNLISKLDSCVTRNRESARIFLEPTFLRVPADPETLPYRLDLYLSAMVWTNWNPELPFVSKTDDHTFRICYATHNSFNEIKDFLLYMKPEKVYLNVLPEVLSEKEEMFNQLALILSQYSKNSEEVKVEDVQNVRKFSFNRIRKMKYKNLNLTEKKFLD